MANIKNEKYIITDKERDVRRVARLHDRPNNNGSYGKAGLGPEDVKKAFDEAVDLVVERHNAFVKDVCEQVNEHSELIGDPDDTGAGDENVYQVLRYAKKAIETVSKTLGEESDDSGADTVYGQAKRAETAAVGVEENRKAAEAAADKAEGVLGTENDDSGANTVYGQKAALISAASRLKEETVDEAKAILGDEDDGFDDKTMRGLYNSALELVYRTYPVGAIYLSVNDTSPASLFGGEWERLKDRFLLGAGDTYAAGVTGGSATHTLADSNSPYESLKLFENKKDTAVTGLVGVLWSTPVTVQPHGYVIAKAGEAQSKLGYANSQSRQPVNHMPPYLTVYMWKRTA